MTTFWMRDEARKTERRAPLTPGDAASLIEKGFDVRVERSKKRVFPDHEYLSAGCVLEKTGGWIDAPASTVVLGLKELPDEPQDLPHRYIHFAHLFKDQTGWQNEIARFERGGGSLFDIEYLVGENNRRVAAFGYWAGWIGAAVGLWRLLERRLGVDGIKAGVAEFASQDKVIQDLRELLAQGQNQVQDELPRAVVIGAKGRSGTGAADCLSAVGIPVTRWDMAETADLDRGALLAHDMLVNCVLVTGPGLLLATSEHLRSPASRLTVLSDVACDPLSNFNPLPVYKAPTSWSQPFDVAGQTASGATVEITAIDNLPSLLPGSASEDFSNQFVASLARFPNGAEWTASLRAFAGACARRAETT